MIKKFGIGLIFLGIFLTSTMLYADNYRRAFFDMYSDFSSVPPICSDKNLMGFYNPSSLCFNKTTETEIYWSDDNRKMQDYNNWAVFSGSPNFGLAVVKENNNQDEIYNARVSYAKAVDKKGNLGLGIGYGWGIGGIGSKGFERFGKSYMIYGMLYRAVPMVNFGCTVLAENYSEYKEESYYFVLKPLPFAKDDFALTYEHNYQSSREFRELVESYSIFLRFLKMFIFTARVYPDKAYTVGINWSLHDMDIFTNSFIKRNSNYQNSVYGVGLFQNAEDSDDTEQSEQSKEPEQTKENS